MPTPKKGARLGGSPAHQRLILRNLATELFRHGRITTTEAKARLLRPYAEKLITKAKKGGLHNRRQIAGVLFTEPKYNASGRRQLRERSDEVQHKLMTEIAEMFADRPGGYLRITKLGPRKGDNAPMAVIELVTEPYAPSAPKATPAAPAAAPAPVEDAPVDADVTTEGDAEERLETEAPVAEDAEVVEEAADEAPAEDADKA